MAKASSKKSAKSNGAAKRAPATTRRAGAPVVAARSKAAKSPAKAAKAAPVAPRKSTAKGKAQVTSRTAPASAEGRSAARLAAPIKPADRVTPAARGNTRHTTHPAENRGAGEGRAKADRNNGSPPAPQPDYGPLHSNAKPRKNQAGLSGRDLDHYRDLLLEKRRELVGDMSSMEREALRTSGGSNLSTLPIHMADMGTDNYEQEFTLGLVEKDRVLLREINHALAKIQGGTYGICEGTGLPISKPRLEAQPWARFGIEHARKMESVIRRI